MDTSGSYWNWKRRLTALIEATNTNGICDGAISNIQAGKPAFWSTCGNSNDCDGLLFEAANSHASIEAAQDEYSATFGRRGKNPYDEQHLDYLIPLNRAAVMDLLRAYQAVGTFRSSDELAARAFRRGWHRYRLTGSLSVPVRGADLSHAIAAE